MGIYLITQCPWVVAFVQEISQEHTNRIATKLDIDVVIRRVHM